MIEDLTPHQREKLFELVQYQRDHVDPQKSDIVFYFSDPYENMRIWVQGDEEFFVEVSQGIFNLLKDKSYFHIAEEITNFPSFGARPAHSDVTSRTLVLSKKTLDYEAFMRHRPFTRSLINLWEKLIDDVPSLVWGIIGGTIAAILTIVISKMLGLTK